MADSNLKPAIVWQILADIYGPQAVGASKGKMQGIGQRIKGWLLGQRKLGHAFEIQEDALGNLLVKKPATKGWEACPSVLLQAHYDILNVEEKQAVHEHEHEYGSDPGRKHEREHGREHELERNAVTGRKKKGVEPPRHSSICIDEECQWVEIMGSPFLDDSVVGVALILSVLADTAGDIQHGPLEALFTVKKEGRFLGALDLDPAVFDIQSKLLLNFDAVDIASITNGTAGCGEFLIKTPVCHEAPDDPRNYRFFRMEISGLQGGELGSEIHFLRGNAIKIAARCLAAIEEDVPVWLGHWEAGNTYRFIPRTSMTTFGVRCQDVETMMDKFTREKGNVIKKYQTFSEYGENLEPNLEIEVTEADAFPLLPNSLSSRILALCNWMPQGLIQKLSVENEAGKIANNFSKILITPTHVELYCKTRGDSAAELDHFKRKLLQLRHLGKWEVINDYNFPVWEPAPDGKFVNFVRHVYEDVIHHPVRINRTYWVLEPGVIASKFDQMEVAIIGPTEFGVYPANYRVKVEDVQILYRVLRTILAKIKDLPVS